MSLRFHDALIDASLMHRKRIRQEFQTMELTQGQPKVLAYLVSHEGCLQKELAEQYNLEPATMTVLLRNMAIKGLIQKKTLRAPCGKRAFGVYLTDYGREMAHKSVKVLNDIETISFKGFSEEDKSTLVELLQRVKDNLLDI